MRSTLLLVLTVSFLSLLASGPDSATRRSQAQTSSCASKDCSPSLPWIDFDPACCKNDMRAPYEYYSRVGFVSNTVVHCKEHLDICGTEFNREKDVLRKIGCSKDPYWSFDKDALVCCTAWRNAIKTGKPCDPSKNPTCLRGGPPDDDSVLNDPTSDIQYMNENKPAYIWVSGKGGSADIYDCTKDPPSLLTSENNGTMLPVTAHGYAGGNLHQRWYWVKGERGSGTYEGCMKPEDVSCDPKNVRKE